MENKERPIIFSGTMVRAILSGAKTQTRRAMTPQPQPYEPIGEHHLGIYWTPRPKRYAGLSLRRMEQILDFCPYGQPGDRLWVRESAWYRERDNRVFYADGTGKTKHGQQSIEGKPIDEQQMRGDGWRQKPSIHMPRWASRITLEIVSVRVERLQDISEQDARAEGVNPSPTMEMRDGSPCYSIEFRKLWTTINGIDNPKEWAANPWVWVVEFRRFNP